MTDHAMKLATTVTMCCLALPCYLAVAIAWSRWFGRHVDRYPLCNTPASWSTQGRPAPRRR